MSFFFFKKKVALCFIISYDHVLIKEDIWREWIKPNEDIINIYFFYKDKLKIKSGWIKDHAIDEKYIVPTTYLNVVPAYLNVMKYAFDHDRQNQWFCLLTDSCCPIISPEKFRNLFHANKHYSLMRWSSSWWNITFHKRANLALLPKKFHLANDPWFILRREELNVCLRFIRDEYDIFCLICGGGLANESIFAIIFQLYDLLKEKVVKNENDDSAIKSVTTHLTDWSRMTSPTSPYVFNQDTTVNRLFIENGLEKNKHAMFLRKVGEECPDKMLKYYIYEYSSNENNENKKNILIKYDLLKRILLFISLCLKICVFILIVVYGLRFLVKFYL